MKILGSLYGLFLLLCFAAVLFRPGSAGAEDLIVDQSDPAAIYSAIQPAIDFAAAQLASGQTTTSYRVIVKPGTYAGGITLKNNIPVLGTETLRTIVNGGNTGTAMTASGVSGVAVRRLTFLSAATGISLSNGSSVDITNNVFALGEAGTAIIVQDSPSSSVINNTFIGNSTAVTRNAAIAENADDVKIINNIFSNNTSNIKSTYNSDANINNNFFQPAPADAELKGSPYFPNTDITGTDPLFVSAAAVPDAHLQASSPCIDRNNSISDLYSISTNSNSIYSDLGAYGGFNSDTIPAQVTGLTATATSTAPYAITLNWNSSANYLVGGYKVYYGTASATYDGADAKDGSGASLPSPVEAGVATTLTLNDLAAAAVTPAAPVLNTPMPRNGALAVSWSSVPGAANYTVHYGILDTSEQSLDAGTATSLTIPNLMNGQPYKIAVTATAQSTYYVTVTAYDKSSGPFTPGSEHESAHAAEIPVSIGQVYVSGLSNEATGIPERLSAYPALPNTGCFIATAAYGSLDAPPVRILRLFRDRHLRTTPAGRAFIGWYYSVSPALAAVVNDHPVLKPLVQIALAPLVLLAALANEAAHPFAALFLSGAGIVLLLIVRSRGKRRRARQILSF